MLRFLGCPRNIDFDPAGVPCPGRVKFWPNLGYPSLSGTQLWPSLDPVWPQFGQFGRNPGSGEAPLAGRPGTRNWPREPPKVQKNPKFGKIWPFLTQNAVRFEGLPRKRQNLVKFRVFLPFRAPKRENPGSGRVPLETPKLANPGFGPPNGSKRG